MKKVFKPFWSYDVKKTEEWLSAMAEKGYYLVDFNRWTRCFLFQQGEAKKVRYRIAYDKVKGNTLAKSLVNEGWIKVIQGGNWLVISNEKPVAEIKTSSVREGIIKRNRLIKYIFSGLLIYLSSIVVVNLGMLSLASISDGPVEVVESPLWILTYTFFGAVVATIVLAIYSIIKINKTNKYLIQENANKLEVGENSLEERYSKEKERRLKRSGQMIVKRKPGWMYAPDKLENWLETMEEQGCNLYRVGKLGTTFFFLKGASRKVSYCADYQNLGNESYLDFHREAGWKSVYNSYSSLQKWTIWSKEYSEGTEKPQIYSDRTHLLKHAKKVAFAYTILFFPLVAVYLLNIGLYYDIFLNNDNNPSKLELTNMIMFVFLIFVFGSFIVRSWLYYFRTKKTNRLQS